MLRAGRELNERMPAGDWRWIAVIRLLTRGQGATEAVGETIAREKTGLYQPGDETVWARWSGSGGFVARGCDYRNDREQLTAAD